jgi:hypothetical protein
MNKIIPILSPICTSFVCCPSNVPSLIISLHQVYITYKIITNPVSTKVNPPIKLCINITMPDVKEKAPIAATKGQGDGSTK